MQARRKAGRRPWLIISSVTILTLALLSGAIFFLLPKITAAGVNKPLISTGQGSTAANTVNSTVKTGNANNAKITNNAGQVAPQPTQAAATTTKQGSNSTTMGNGNTMQATPTTTTNNTNQAPAPATVPQNATVSVVMLQQYVGNIRHMVAQSFNITDKALALQLQNGMHLKGIAMQHGLSDTQLQSLLSTSISTGFQPAINTGILTQGQVSTFIQQTQQNPTTLEQQLSILPPANAHW